MCCTCGKTIDIALMGESSLKSHIKSAKHVKNSAAVTCVNNIKESGKSSPISTAHSELDSGSSESDKDPKMVYVHIFEYMYSNFVVSKWSVSMYYIINMANI